jgi:hypothetical protein
MTLADWIQLGSLIVSVVGLVFLVKYVCYTRKIAEQTVTQTEASFKPAIIAIGGEHTNAPLGLRNIGKGPALEVEWAITGTEKHGKISYIEAGNACEALPVPAGTKSLFEGATKSNAVAIRCSYRSISGRTYTSLSDYDLDRGRFSTTFEG